MEIVIDTNLLVENLPNKSTKHFQKDLYLRLASNSKLLITPFTMLEACNGNIINEQNCANYLRNNNLEVLSYSNLNFYKYDSLSKYITDVKYVAYCEVLKFANYYVMAFLSTYSKVIGINLKQELLKGNNNYLIKNTKFEFKTVSKQRWDEFEKRGMLELIYQNLLHYCNLTKLNDADEKIKKVCIDNIDIDFDDETIYFLKKIRERLNKYIYSKKIVGMKPDFIDLLICHTCFQNTRFPFLTRDEKLIKFIKIYGNKDEIEWLLKIGA